MEFADKQEEQVQTLNHVINAMTQRLHVLQECGDHRAVFQRVYLLMTQEMQRRLTSGFFRDPAWMERVLVRFARYYFNAIDAYEAGQSCPPAWDLAFRLAVTKQGFVLQDALLGINAHINNDLPMVLYTILDEDNAWPDARIMLYRRQDHEKINTILANLMDLVQDELAFHHARFIRAIDHIMGRRDESFSQFILTHCRTNVWYNTELLLDAPDEEQRNIHRQRIEHDAYTIGLQIAHPRAFRLIKSLAPFTRQNRWL